MRWPDPRAAIGNVGVQRLLECWASLAESDGKVSERLELIALSGWAPAPDQAKPARRGSGKVSLADALRPGGQKPV